MKLKEGVIMSGLRLPMRVALIKADEIWNRLGQELVVTSATDGTHSPGSLHYYGYALDFRTRYFDKVTAKDAAKELHEALGGSISGHSSVHNPYRVILHKTHIHVEWRGMVGGSNTSIIN
jgi:hypothetical protein